MQLRKWLEQWDLDSLKIKAGFLEMEWVPRDEDRAAAWDLYVEMITRVATQELAPDAGQESAALESIYQLFPLTREIIRKHGRYSIGFAKIAVPLLNQKVRPFTTRWHGRLPEVGEPSAADATAFCTELAAVQKELRKYTRLLADLAGVEDLTHSESEAI